MKVCNEIKFEVIVATHYGMCFGVKAAIKTAQKLAKKSPVTILGELAHNATVKTRLEQQGAKHTQLDAHHAGTKHVVITAHGASDRERKRWHTMGYLVTDTTCPLVHKAHAALRDLVEAGYSPIVIGKSGHTEVRGLIGDFPEAQVVLNPEDLDRVTIINRKIGIISQTTQQIDHVEMILAALKRKFPKQQMKFIDTVCRPTKNRQIALLELCAKVRIVIVVGGKNSNNTAQLAEKCRALGCRAYHIQQPDDIQLQWLNDIDAVGLTAGTSTPDEDVELVKRKLLEISAK